MVFFGVLQGILIAIALSILLFFRRNWWPHGAVLGNVAGARAGTTSRRGTAPSSVPGIVVFRWEAPLFFANAGLFRRQRAARSCASSSRAGSSCSARR